MAMVSRRKYSRAEMIGEGKLRRVGLLISQNLSEPPVSLLVAVAFALLCGQSLRLRVRRDRWVSILSRAGVCVWRLTLCRVRSNERSVPALHDYPNVLATFGQVTAGSLRRYAECSSRPEAVVRSRLTCAELFGPKPCIKAPVRVQARSCTFEVQRRWRCFLLGFLIDLARACSASAAACSISTCGSRINTGRTKRRTE